MSMRHMNYLELVANGDIKHLREKEATYKGSWKSQGGKNAWAMIRRKIDRLMVMLGEPEKPSQFSINRILESETEIEINEAEIRYLALSYLAGDIFSLIEKDMSGADGTVLAEVRDLRRYLLLVEAEMVSRTIRHEEKPDFDESRHASDYPWRINSRQYERLSGDAQEFYRQRTVHLYVAEPYSVAYRIPAMLNGLYRRVDDGWVIDIELVPESIRDVFPSLHLERNDHEHGQLPKWQQELYTWDKDTMKHMLENKAWHVDSD